MCSLKEIEHTTKSRGLLVWISMIIPAVKSIDSLSSYTKNKLNQSMFFKKNKITFVKGFIMPGKFKKHFPLGIQTFAHIRDPKMNYAYIDKTQIVYDMIETRVKYRFLSRPRRFGKSLFLDTLSELFKGSEEMFEGLYVYDKWDWETKYPVIKINW